ncbi:hypothetical protein CL630_00665 [bacterium]|nr:hypothetical protein [bacterium]
MGRRKLKDRNIRSLTRNSGGRSYVITVPIDVVREWKWQHRQKLELTFDHRRQRIIIADWKKKNHSK